MGGCVTTVGAPLGRLTMYTPVPKGAWIRPTTWWLRAGSAIGARGHESWPHQHASLYPVSRYTGHDPLLGCGIMLMGALLVGYVLVLVATYLAARALGWV